MIKKLLSVAGLLLLAQLANGQITFDGNITESAWGTPVATQSGGPAPGFGAGHEINALYITNDNTNLNIALAGNVQNNNRIMLFIDSTSGGYNTANFGRNGAPGGASTFNSGNVFDSGFSPDYVLTIGTNSAHDTFFFDLYTLSGSVNNASDGGPDTFLNAAGLSLGASPANGDNTRGFELQIPFTYIKYVLGTNISFFAAYQSDGGFLSNQFLTHADSNQGNFGSGAVNFNNEPPNPISMTLNAVPEPSSLALLGGPAILGAWFYIRRRRA